MKITYTKTITAHVTVPTHFADELLVLSAVSSCLSPDELEAEAKNENYPNTFRRFLVVTLFEVQKEGGDKVVFELATPAKKRVDKEATPTLPGIEPVPAKQQAAA